MCAIYRPIYGEDNFISLPIIKVFKYHFRDFNDIIIINPTEWNLNHVAPIFTFLQKNLPPLHWSAGPLSHYFIFIPSTEKSITSFGAQRGALKEVLLIPVSFSICSVFVGCFCYHSDSHLSFRLTSGYYRLSLDFRFSLWLSPTVFRAIHVFAYCSSRIVYHFSELLSGYLLIWIIRWRLIEFVVFVILTVLV